MIETLITFLQTHILPWGAVGVFVASVIEEVVAPIPSALVVMMSGFIFAENASSLVFKVAIPAAIGTTLGSYAIYFAARYGGKFVIERWGKFLGLYWADIEKLQSKLTGTHKDEIIISIARMTPVIPSVAVSAFCGFSQMKVEKYFVITLAGVFVRSLILGAVGWQTGSFYQKYAEAVSKMENLILLSTFVVLALFFVLKYKGRILR